MKEIALNDTYRGGRPFEQPIADYKSPFELTTTNAFDLLIDTLLRGFVMPNSELRNVWFTLLNVGLGIIKWLDNLRL
jgi:hypothetical protein